MHVMNQFLQIVPLKTSLSSMHACAAACKLLLVDMYTRHGTAPQPDARTDPGLTRAP